MLIKKLVATSLITLTLSACMGNLNSSPNQSATSKQNVGTLVGAVGGAWAGSNLGKGKGNIAAIAAGTLLGAALGNQLGATLDRADMAYYNQTSQYSLEKTKTGSTSTWHNPDSGNKGTITPVRTFQSNNGSYCREYTQTIYIGGEETDGHGVACRQPDGTWQIQQ